MLCSLTIPRDIAGPGTGQAVFDWTDNGMGVKEEVATNSTATSTRALQEEEEEAAASNVTESTEEINEGTIIPLHPFEKYILDEYSWHL
jgi:hypothetical protein